MDNIFKKGIEEPANELEVLGQLFGEGVTIIPAQPVEECYDALSPTSPIESDGEVYRLFLFHGDYPANDKFQKTGDYKLAFTDLIVAKDYIIALAEMEKSRPGCEIKFSEQKGIINKIVL